MIALNKIRFVVNKVDMVICVSQRIRDELQKKEVEESYFNRSAGSLVYCR